MERCLSINDTSARNKGRSIKTLLWRDVRDRIELLKPELASIIDEIDPPDSCRMYEINYQYGEEIVRKGQLMLPDPEGNLQFIHKSKALPHIHEDLNYNYGTNAFCMILSNQIELYLNLRDRTIPIYTGGPGDVIGMWAALSRTCNHQPPFLWNISAGARSVFMLPKISDRVAHTRLNRHLHIKTEKPQQYVDHWKIFTSIASNPSLANPWHCEMLAFSKNWFQNFDDKAWQPLHYYFLKSTWDNTEYFRNIYIWNTVFSYIVEKRQLRPNPYLHDTVRHLFGIAVGGVPGFAPLTDNTLGPTSDIQQAYSELYRLKDSAPIIMGPANIRQSKEHPVYYSLNFPTTAVFSPKNRNRSNLIGEVNEFNDLLNKYIQELGKTDYNLDHSLLHSIVHSTNFKMIHSSPSDNYILSSKRIPEIDSRFTAIGNRFKHSQFPENSSFWNGAVAITPKHAEDS